MNSLLLLLALFLGVPCFIQKIYSAQYDNQADLKVYDG